MRNGCGLWCALCIVHCALCIVHCALCIGHWTLCAVYHVKCVMCSGWCIVCCVLFVCPCVCVLVFVCANVGAGVCRDCCAAGYPIRRLQVFLAHSRFPVCLCLCGDALLLCGTFCKCLSESVRRVVCVCRKECRGLQPQKMPAALRRGAAEALLFSGCAVLPCSTGKDCGVKKHPSLSRGAFACCHGWDDARVRSGIVSEWRRRGGGGEEGGSGAWKISAMTFRARKPWLSGVRLVCVACSIRCLLCGQCTCVCLLGRRARSRGL